MAQERTHSARASEVWQASPSTGEEKDAELIVPETQGPALTRRREGRRQARGVLCMEAETGSVSDHPSPLTGSTPH